MQNIIIIGARGYKAKYGGWETFVTRLIQNYQDKNVVFHVPELTHQRTENKKIVDKDGVSCLQVYSPRVGFVTMFIYAIFALKYMKKYIKEQNLQHVILYVLGCRMGPFYPFLLHSIKKQGIKVYLNPDGLEWKREKWSWWIKQCFKISEWFMVRFSDILVCDAKAIKEYIDTKYKSMHKRSVFIPYGAELFEKGKKNAIVKDLFQKYMIKEEEYYLLVGRFVPENNYELILREFRKTKTKKDLVIIANVEENKFYKSLEAKTEFLHDKRIKFIGTVYDKEALIYIRKKAYAYIHGHSAGGTNPSLLEALANTKVNILFSAIYNVEVGAFSSLYFSKNAGDLKRIIEKCEDFDEKTRKNYEKLAKARIEEAYTWKLVVEEYKKLWSE